MATPRKNPIIRRLKLVWSPHSVSGWHEPRDLKCENMLDRGKFAQVWRVSRDDIKDRDGKRALIVAAKIFPKNNDNTEEAVKEEVRIMYNVKHENIVRCFALYQNEDFFVAITEFANGGNLAGFLKKYKYTREEDAADIIRQTLNALEHMHGKTTMHKDVKPENILFKYLVKYNHETGLEKNEILLCDFGTAVESKTSKEDTGTPNYAAPEILKAQEHTNKVDIWAVGITAYEMLCGERPFTVPAPVDPRIRLSRLERMKRFRQVETVLEGAVLFNQSIWSSISDDAKNFIRCCLDKDAEGRMSAKQALGHDWIKNNSSGSLNVKNDANNHLSESTTASGLSLEDGREVNPSRPRPKHGG